MLIRCCDHNLRLQIYFQIEDYQKQLEAKTFELQNMRLQFEKMKSEQASWNATLVKRSAALNTCTQENRSLSEQLRTVLNKLKVGIVILGKHLKL